MSLGLLQTRAESSWHCPFKQLTKCFQFIPVKWPLKKKLSSCLRKLISALVLFQNLIHNAFQPASPLLKRVLKSRSRNKWGKQQAWGTAQKLQSLNSFLPAPNMCYLGCVSWDGFFLANYYVWDWYQLHVCTFGTFDWYQLHVCDLLPKLILLTHLTM